VGLACPDQIADVQALVDRLPQALAELVEACRMPSPSAHAMTAASEPRQEAAGGTGA
jgi:hypothetical protein